MGAIHLLAGSALKAPRRNQRRGRVRIILQNVNDLTKRKGELGWFLENEEREGRPVLAYCMTEPMIPEGWKEGMRRIRVDDAKQRERPISMKHHGVVTVRELELEHKHMGITWVAIEMGATQKGQCAPYGDIRGSQGMQREATAHAATEVRAMGYAVLVATDFNCPFKERGILANSKHNAVYWKKLRSITGMPVMNWEQTSSRAQKSQLDMVLVDRELVISGQKGYDHCMIVTWQ